MRCARVVFTLVSLLVPLMAQQKKDEGPTDEKAQKTFQKALDLLHQRMVAAAFDELKKADKQDGGHCKSCQLQIIKYGTELHEWKSAELAAEELVAEAQGQTPTALAHYQFGMLLFDEALDRHKDEIFRRVHEEMTKAIATVPKFPAVVFEEGSQGSLAWVSLIDTQARQLFLEQSRIDG